MTQSTLGNSQHPEYDGLMEAEIGARVRERIKTVMPGVPQADIARLIELPADAFSRSLNGKRAFTAVELVELAHLLRTSAHWFITGEEDPFAVRYAGRHTFDRDLGEHVPIDWDDEHRPLADVALAYVQAYAGDDLPPVRRNPTSAADARKRLIEVGGEGFIRHLADHIEIAFGIDVVRISAVSRGFAIEVLRRSVIVIDETPNWFRENFSLAHELAHVLAGELSELGDKACDDPAAEKRANAFAAELLLPASRIRSIDWMSASTSFVAEFLWETGVSTEALGIRFGGTRTKIGPEVGAALALKTQALLRQCDVPAEGELISERMRDATQRRFPRHLVAAHRAAVSDGKLGPQTLAWMLGVDPETLEEELAPPVVSADIDWLARELGLTD